MPNQTLKELVELYWIQGHSIPGELLRSLEEADKTIAEAGGLVPMSRDIRAAAATLSDNEARFLVDSYYQRQKDRIETDNQIKSMSSMSSADIKKYGWHSPDSTPDPFGNVCDFGESCHDPKKQYSVTAEPHAFYLWLYENEHTLEKRIGSALGVYASAQPVGIWAQSITGVGPIITAGLLAHIDIVGTRYAGRIWKFAGQVPGVKWEKGQKRPWNASLKTLCWKIGESFVISKGRENSFYGPLFDERKAYEARKNAAGDYAAQAATLLKEKKYDTTTETYKHLIAGHLSPAQMHARAKRWTVKLFLSHLHAVGYEMEHGIAPPDPYAMGMPSHVHKIAPPNWPMK